MRDERIFQDFIERREDEAVKAALALEERKAQVVESDQKEIQQIRQELTSIIPEQPTTSYPSQIETVISILPNKITLANSDVENSGVWAAKVREKIAKLRKAA